MKTKQSNLKAVFSTENNNAKNMGNTRETVSRYLVIDKKKEKQIVDCRCYMGRSKEANTVYASLWISSVDGSFWTSGSGKAGGYGYHKESSAIEDAIRSAGIELFGSVYCRQDEKVNFKKQAYIGGVGETAIEAALLTIAYAAGCKDAIFVSC